MFIDASPNYTDTALNYKKNNLIVFETFVKKERNLLNCSDAKIFMCTNIPTASYSFAVKKTRKTAPKRLKDAMFRTSSRGIAVALNKK